MNHNYLSNRAPLMENAFEELPLGTIMPDDWLYNQLKLQAAGLTGNLEEIWEFVGPNSGWLGGSGESWERGPYYCDGLIPLAYILKDPVLIKKSQKWIEWTLGSQREDGYFGPGGNDDWWPRMVILKVLIQYYGASKDSRVISFMTRYFKYQYRNIVEKPLQMWATARGGENLLCIYWLYNNTGEQFLLELADIIFRQTIDWTSVFLDFPYKHSTREYLSWDYFTQIGWDEIRNPQKISMEEAERLFQIYHQTHVVNVAMAIKEPAVYYQQSGKEEHKAAAYQGIGKLMEYHGVANGMFTGDEHLSGNDPTQGTELCAVVEYMFSLETLVKIFGKVEDADILEKVAYNALPATLKPDITGHQYDQQVNQIMCTVQERNWYNNEPDSNIFGLEPNFGCCTANMHQGWPKFVNCFWMSTGDDGLAAVIYGPCTVSAKVKDGRQVQIIEQTNYPFGGEIKFTIKECEQLRFPIRFRIPSWAKGARLLLNGNTLPDVVPGEFFTIDREWNSEDHVEINLPMNIRTSRWINNSVSIERGPLVFALGLGEEWKRLKGVDPYADWEVYPKSPWNYGILLDSKQPDKSFEVVERPIGFQPFSPRSAPVYLIAKGRKISNWTVQNSSAGDIPLSPVTSQEDSEDIVLIPYGSTNIRIAQFPEAMDV